MATRALKGAVKVHYRADEGPKCGRRGVTKLATDISKVTCMACRNLVEHGMFSPSGNRGGQRPGELTRGQRIMREL